MVKESLRERIKKNSKHHERFYPLEWKKELIIKPLAFALTLLMTCGILLKVANKCYEKSKTMKRDIMLLGRIPG